MALLKKVGIMVDHAKASFESWLTQRVEPVAAAGNVSVALEVIAIGYSDLRRYCEPLGVDPRAHIEGACARLRRAVHGSVAKEKLDAAITANEVLRALIGGCVKPRSW